LAVFYTGRIESFLGRIVVVADVCLRVLVTVAYAVVTYVERGNVRIVAASARTDKC